MRFGINNPAFLQAASSVAKMITPAIIIESLADNNVFTLARHKEFYIDNVKYSVNNTGYKKFTSDFSVTLNRGDKLSLANTVGGSFPTRPYHQMPENKMITSTGGFKVSGVLASLYYPLEEELPDSAFCALFEGTKIVDASELDLGDQASEGCYNALFRNCSLLNNAPVIKIKKLKNACLNYMFKNCTSLNAITCLAEETEGAYTSAEWVLNVGEDGNFTKPGSATFWTTGVNGIPQSWYVVNL